MFKKIYIMSSDATKTILCTLLAGAVLSFTRKLARWRSTSFARGSNAEDLARVQCWPKLQAHAYQSVDVAGMKMDRNSVQGQR